jgi:hypothetical protein
VAVFYRGRTFHLSKPIDLVKRRAAGRTILAYEPLDLVVWGGAEQKALDSFSEEIAFLWDHYGSADDSALTLDAQELKRKVRALVEHVE